MAFIYILHLDTKLAHAQHYCGSTKNLRQRLKAHAFGNAARFTEVLRAKNIDWRLGGLYQCNHATMRRLERVLKDNHRKTHFCEICDACPGTLPGTLKYDVALLKFPTSSAAIRRHSAPPPPITCRLATMLDCKPLTAWIMKIMLTERDALGFIPGGSGKGVEDMIRLGRILVAECERHVIGYIAHTAAKDGTRLTIHQCATADEFRYYGVGRMMVNRLREMHPTHEMVAKVKYNLAANHFWLRIGFHLITSLPHETSGNLINHYYLTPQMPLQ